MMILRTRALARRLLLVGLATLALGQTTRDALAQQEPPEPKDVRLMTKDGVQLQATYYPAAPGEKQEIVPIVLLHDYKESRAVYDDLARYLQRAPIDDSEKAPRAVLTVDFRGHGDSKTAQTIDGSTIELDAANFRTADYEAMVVFDMEAVRKFLVQKNNAGELNLNQLGVLGAGMGANVAMLWTARDWSMPPLPRLKQGQDVKALMLISPRWNYRGLPLVGPMKHPAIQREISVLLAYGDQDRKVTRDAEVIHKTLKRFHPEPPRDRMAELKDLYFVGLPTSLQGAELVTKRQFKLVPLIERFIELRLGQKEFRWLDRTVK